MKAINLLPPDLRGTPKSVSSKAKTAAVNDEPGGIGAFVVLGALTVCVIALAAYVLTNNAIKDRQAQLDAATSQAQSITQRVAQLKPYADFKAMAETRIQTVKDLASSRFDWEQAMRDISRAIPAERHAQDAQRLDLERSRAAARRSALRSPRRRSSSRVARRARRRSPRCCPACAASTASPA